MPKLFGNNYTNIGTTENPIYRSTSSGGGAASSQLSLDGARTGAMGLVDFTFGSKRANVSHISSYPDITNGTGYDVQPGASYRFYYGSIIYRNGVDTTTIIPVVRATMNPVAEISSLSVFESSTTKIFVGSTVSPGGSSGATYNLYAYIYQGKLRILWASSTDYTYSHHGTFMILESFE